LQRKSLSVHTTHGAKCGPMVKQEIHSLVVLRVFVKVLTLAINRNILVRG